MALLSGAMTMNLRRNAMTGVAEQVVVGIAFFLTYGILIRETGAEMVGVLSLVLVLASIGSMTSAGFASALAHFVPAFESEGDRNSSLRCIDTTFFSTASLYFITLAITYVPFSTLIAAQAGALHRGLVFELMIPATLHVFLIGTGATMTSALTALRRNDLRLWATCAGSAAGLAVLITALPSRGVAAGVWGFAAQSGTIALVAWVQLVRLLPGLGPVPRRFDRVMARRLFGLGSNMQVQTLLLAALEPVTRLLIGHYGSLSAVAFFSMANRFVIQMRAVIYSGAQPLLSAFSHARAESPETLSGLYWRARDVVEYGAILTLSATIGAAPFVADIWIGANEPSFVLFTAILGLGWLANSLSLTAYFNAYSLGRMNQSLVGHAMLLGLNVTLGAGLAAMLGGAGAVAGLGIALVISALYLGTANGAHAPPNASHRHWSRLVLLSGSSAVAAAASIGVYTATRSGWPPLAAGLASGAVWAACISPGAISHPVFLSFWRQIHGRRRARPT